MSSKVQFVILACATTVAAVLLVAWTWGLLGPGDDDDGEVLLEHEWTAGGTDAEAQFHQVNRTFSVGSGVVRLRIEYKVDLPSDITVGIPGSSGSPSPEVDLQVLDASGSIVWTDSLYSSAGGTEEVNVTTAGTWTLVVWAKGYGYEGETVLGTTVEFHDSLKVTVLAI